MSAPHHEDEARVFDLSKGMVSVNPETLVRLLWAIVILGFSATTLAAKFAWDANNELRDLHQAIDSTSRMIEARTTDRWTLSMMRKHDDELRLRNPMLAIPDADDIHNRLMPR